MAGAAIAGTEDEDPAEYFDGHEDVGELRDPVDGVEAVETTKAKHKKLDRLAEYVALGKKRVTARWEKGRNQGTIRCKGVQER